MPATVWGAPLSDESYVWRFMEFWKFKDLIETSAIYMSRMDKLRDPWEGASMLSGGSAETRHRQQQEHYDQTRAYLLEVFPNKTLQMPYGDDELRTKILSWSRKWTYVSCWYCSEYESNLMWTNYAGMGVGIRSTFGKLRNFFDSDCFLGPVNYADSKAQEVSGSWPAIFFNKHVVYSSEREVRVLLNTKHKLGVVSEVRPDENGPDGIRKRGPITNLLDEIVLAPAADEELLRSVPSILKEHKLELPIRPSILDSQPKW